MDPDAEDGSRVRFVLAMAPQLVALRITNGPWRGLPINLLHHILQTATHLQRLDMKLILDQTSAPTSPLLPFVKSADLPPFHLGCILDCSRRVQEASVTGSKPLQEQLWALFDSRDEGAVAAISALRRVERVILEPWLAEEYPRGVDYATEKMREKGLELRLDSRDLFALNW